jgi:hypothetical protein
MSSRPSARRELLGSTEPRLWTPPLRDLSDPDSTTGYDEITFARDVMGVPLDPWEEWLSIHAGELNEDGTPRFGIVLVLVARQNGKTTWAKNKVGWWMHMEEAPLTLLTSTNRGMAKRLWNAIRLDTKSNPHLKRDFESERLTISEESLILKSGAELVFAANNGAAGRSLTVDRWLCDELREHHNTDAWDSASNAMNAVWDAQIVCITNQGDDESVVLDMLRGPALDFIETGEGDPTIGLFEWSSPDGADPTDMAALAQANPNLGLRVNPHRLLSKARNAEKAGGVALAKFRTEAMCQRVDVLNPAIEPSAWKKRGAKDPIQLSEHRDKVALCFDISMDERHVALVAAALVDGKVHVEPVQAWSGEGCIADFRRDIPKLAEKIKPRAIGWFPNGPAASVAADMTASRTRGWPPRRVTLEPLKTETTAVCMGLAQLVLAGEIAHTNDPMLDAHVAGAQRLQRGDGWIYARRGRGPVDGAYAAAGAVHLARTLPAAPPPLRVL